MSAVEPIFKDDGRRLHDLRNAVNAITMNTAVLKRLLQTGQAERALAIANRLEDACTRCRELLVPEE